MVSCLFGHTAAVWSQRFHLCPSATISVSAAAPYAQPGAKITRRRQAGQCGGGMPRQQGSRPCYHAPADFNRIRQATE
jgi:hypothetical protein